MSIRGSIAPDSMRPTVDCGTPAREAIEKVESAMEIWTDYEDAHLIEIPSQDFMNPINQIMSKFAEVTDTIKRKNEVDAEFASPDELCRMEQEAWDNYRALQSEVEALHESMSPESTMQMDQQVLELERHWLSFGTAHLRLQLAQLGPPRRPAASQNQDGPKA